MIVNHKCTTGCRKKFQVIEIDESEYDEPLDVSFCPYCGSELIEDDFDYDGDE